MAKLATIEYNDEGKAIVIHSDLPEPSNVAKPPDFPSKNGIPLSPLKPYTSRNFYDLTNSVSPESNPKSGGLLFAEMESSKESMSQGSMDQENIYAIPGPFAQTKKTM